MYLADGTTRSQWVTRGSRRPTRNAREGVPGSEYRSLLPATIPQDAPRPVPANPAVPTRRDNLPGHEPRGFGRVPQWKEHDQVRVISAHIGDKFAISQNDASAHSSRQHSRIPFSRGFGFHPLPGLEWRHPRPSRSKANAKQIHKDLPDRSQPDKASRVFLVRDPCAANAADQSRTAARIARRPAPRQNIRGARGPTLRVLSARHTPR